MGYGLVTNEVAGSEISMSSCYCLFYMNQQKSTEPNLSQGNLTYSKALKLNADAFWKRSLTAGYLKLT